MTRFSAADLAGIAGTSRTLLTPLAFATTEDWQRAVTRELRALLGADLASMTLPASTGGRFFSEQIPPTATSGYSAAIRPLDVRWSVWERQASLGAWDRATLWGEAIGEYLESPYYHEFVVPQRIFDGVGLATPFGPPGTPVNAQTAAALWMHHERVTGPRFGERGLAVLRALQPAFAAGVAVLGQLGTQRAALARTLDAMGLALLVVDCGGRAVHRTPRLVQLLAEDPEGARLLGVMAEAAGAVARIALDATTKSARGRARSGGEFARATSQEVQTRHAPYRLRATLTAPELLGSAPAVLVVIERADSGPPTLGTLRTRFGLTPAQARVALLLAQGATPADVAVQCHVSVHTVQRHAEAVRVKLGVRRTAGIAAAVLRGTESAHRDSGRRDGRNG